jgi:hypothetical protein
MGSNDRSRERRPEETRLPAHTTSQQRLARHRGSCLPAPSTAACSMQGCGRRQARPQPTSAGRCGGPSAQIRSFNRKSIFLAGRRVSVRHLPDSPPACHVGSMPGGSTGRAADCLLRWLGVRDLPWQLLTPGAPATFPQCRRLSGAWRTRPTFVGRHVQPGADCRTSNSCRGAAASAVLMVTEPKWRGAWL